MLCSVFIDLRYFLLFFALFNSMFACLLYIVFDNHDSNFFIMAFRSSIGDNEMGDYLSSQQNELAWTIWLLIMIVGNMVMMNFIIAVVNESYESCMSKINAYKFKVKIDMIVELESIMTATDLQDQLKFPNYMVYRRKVNTASVGVPW